MAQKEKIYNIKNFKSVFADLENVERATNDEIKIYEKIKQWGPEMYMDNAKEAFLSGVSFEIAVPNRLSSILTQYAKKCSRYGNCYSLEVESLEQIESINQYWERIKIPVASLEFERKMNESKKDSWTVNLMPRSCISSQYKSVDIANGIKDLKNNMDFFEKLISDAEFLSQVLEKMVSSYLN